MKMKTTPLAVALTLAVLLSASIGMVLADPVDLTNPIWTRGNACTTLLENKDPTLGWAPIDDDIRGWITHGMIAEAFEGQVEVKGLSPDTWYLVTFFVYYTDDLTTYGLIDSSAGLFGGKSDGTIAWTDIALFKTDGEGNAEVPIPYSSGLTAADLNNPPVYNPSPSLPAGVYTKVHVDVKNVGVSDGTYGPAGGPKLWGTGSLLSPLWDPPHSLFEWDVLSFEVTP